MDTSMLRFKIFVDDHLRQRVTAIFMNNLWDSENADVLTEIPLEAIMWAVASNDSILNQVVERMSNAGEDSSMYDPAVKQTADSDLEYVVLSVALPRLKTQEENRLAAIKAAQEEADQQAREAAAELEAAQAQQKV